MLSKNNKVSQRTFSQIHKNQGRTYYSNSFTLRVYKNQEKKNKIAFIVSKKTSTKAVVRNKLKRRGYAIMREVLDSVKKGFVLVFYIKKEALHKSYKELKNEIHYLLKKANTLCNK